MTPEKQILLKQRERIIAADIKRFLFLQQLLKFTTDNLIAADMHDGLTTLLKNTKKPLAMVCKKFEDLCTNADTWKAVQSDLNSDAIHDLNVIQDKLMSLSDLTEVVEAFEKWEQSQIS